MRQVDLEKLLCIFSSVKVFKSGDWLSLHLLIHCRIGWKKQELDMSSPDYQTSVNIGENLDLIHLLVFMNIH